MKKSFSIGVLGTHVLFVAFRIASARAPNPASSTPTDPAIVRQTGSTTD